MLFQLVSLIFVYDVICFIKLLYFYRKFSILYNDFNNDIKLNKKFLFVIQFLFCFLKSLLKFVNYIQLEYNVTGKCVI